MALSFHPWHSVFQGVRTCSSFYLECSSPRPPMTGPFLIVQVLRVPGLTSYLPSHLAPRQACAHPRVWQLIVQGSNLFTSIYSQVAYGCLCVASPELRTVCVWQQQRTRSIRLKLSTIWPLSGRACQVLLFL